MRSIVNLIPQFIKNMSLGRFIVAICLAIIVWGYVIVSQYPERTLPPQEVSLGETIPPPAEAELEVVPSENPVNTIRVTLSGPAETVINVSLSQIKPYIDLSQCRAPGTCYVKVQLRPGLPQYVNAKLEPDTIPVTLEGRTSKVLPVEVLKSGEVSPDYTLEGDLVANPNQVTITGRQSLVDRVTKAQVTELLTGRIGNLRDTRPVVLADSRSQVITDTSLTISPSTISVSGSIIYKLAPRTVPIRVVTTGEPAPGYIAGNAQATPLLATVVSGNQDALSKLEYVSTAPINISGATSEVSTTVHLQGIVDVTFFGGDTVQVSIGIVPFQTSKTISVQVGVLNQASNLRYSYDPTSVNLTISGPYTAFQPELPLDQIKATVNVQDRGVGIFTLPVQVELPPNLVVTNTPTVKVLISLPPTPTPQPTLAPLPTPTPTPRAVIPTLTPGVTATPSTRPPGTPGTTPPSSSTASNAATTPAASQPPATTTAPAPTQTPVPTVAVAPEKLGTAPEQSPGTSPGAAPSSVALTVQPTTESALTPQPQSLDGQTPAPSTKHSVELLIQSVPPYQDFWLAWPTRSMNLL